MGTSRTNLAFQRMLKADSLYSEKDSLSVIINVNIFLAGSQIKESESSQSASSSSPTSGASRARRISGHHKILESAIPSFLQIRRRN